MSREPHPLQIHIHLVDGSVTRFVQEDPDVAQQTLDAIHPERLFSQRQLVIAGDYSVTAYPTAAVARVDLIGDGIPRWQFHEGVVGIEDITEEEFRQRYSAHAADIPRADQTAAPGEPFTAFREIELVNTERILSEIHFQAAPATEMDRGLLIHRLLTSSVLGSWRRGGGVVLINPEKLVRVTFYPGPAETPPGAWLAHHIPA